nr:unnamed protein product [Callosobruchus analis]
MLISLQPNVSILDVLSDNNIFNNILNPTANPIAQKDIREMLQCFDPKADYPFTDDQQQERSKSMNSPESCITISYLQKVNKFCTKKYEEIAKKLIAERKKLEKITHKERLQSQKVKRLERCEKIASKIVKRLKV